MSNQLTLISIFNIKSNIKYKSLIKDNILNEETKEILKYIEIFDDDISDWNSFGEWFLIKHPMLKPAQVSVYKQIFSGVATIPSGSVEAKLILEEFIKRNAMSEVADAAMSVAEGTSDDVTAVITSVESLARELGVLDDIDKYMVEDELDDLLLAVVGQGGYNWRLQPLNVSLGPIRNGSFINFIARPDSGKTTMLASEATFIAKQIEEGHVIWFNNEEEGRKVKLRCVQAALGRTIADIEADPSRAWREYADAIGGADKIKFYSRPSFAVRDIEEVLAQYDPKLIIFDQLRKVKGFEKSAHNDVGRMELLFQQAREWSNMYGPVFNVHQAGGSAEGKQWIDMNEVYGSQTAIQGESEAIVTIGRIHEPGYEFNRYINIPKNKLPGGPPPFDEAQRSGKHEVMINPTIARFEI